jgi:2-polyprenyl-3-methyl-5-hydroxy-6-metoxy-1,4-benzoquinol methylase
MEKLVSTEIVENTLAKSDIHEKWIGDYFSDDNKDFYLNAFAYLNKKLTIPVGAHILDVGCGSGTHSITLARMGFYVTAIDYSDHVLSIAKNNVEKVGLQDKITLMQNNILQLINLPEFDYVLCWGVLMHIPEYKRHFCN